MPDHIDHQLAAEDSAESAATMASLAIAALEGERPVAAQVYATLAGAHAELATASRIAVADEHRQDRLKDIEIEIERFAQVLNERPIG